MIRLITFGNTKAWLFIQQLYRHNDNYTKNLIQENKFLCYYKFSEPTVIAFGELIQSSGTNLPKIFDSVAEAEKFATDYVAEKFNLKDTQAWHTWVEAAAHNPGEVQYVFYWSSFVLNNYYEGDDFIKEISKESIEILPAPNKQ